MLMKSLMDVYIGTYTETVYFSSGKILEGKGEGIYHFHFDLDARKLFPVSVRGELPNPSFVIRSPSGRFLYAASEVKQCRGDQFGGEIGAYAVTSKGDLTFLNRQKTNGTDCCHVAVNQKETHVSLVNYGSGSFCIFPIRPDGTVAEYSHFIEHSGKSVHPKRQTKAYPHSTVFSPDGCFMYILDLGIDQLVAYRTDFERGKFERDEAVTYQAQAGRGPRHGEFHPNGKYLYVINELDCTLSALAYRAETGELLHIQTVPAIIHETESMDNTSADIHITPDGRYVYASTRGDNSVVAYEIDQNNGKMSSCSIISSGGIIPRGFAVDPTGTVVLVANQNTDNVVIFDIDSDTGRLSQIGEINVPSPVCIRMYVKNS
jgi:6-phosphogluconolactonase